MIVHKKVHELVYYPNKCKAKTYYVYKVNEGLMTPDFFQRTIRNKRKISVLPLNHSFILIEDINKCLIEIDII